MICLDVLRALATEPPETAQVFLQEVGRAKGAHPSLDAHIKVCVLLDVCGWMWDGTGGGGGGGGA